MDTTEQKLHAIVTKHLGAEAEKVTNTAKLVDDLGADSLDVVELVIALEDEFEVEITDDAAEKVTTVGDFLPLLEKPAAPEAAAE